MSGFNGQTFLLELAKVFEEEISKNPGKHYVRIEDLDPVHALRIAPMISVSLTSLMSICLNTKREIFV